MTAVLEVCAICSRSFASGCASRSSALSVRSTCSKPPATCSRNCRRAFCANFSRALVSTMPCVSLSLYSARLQSTSFRVLSF